MALSAPLQQPMVYEGLFGTRGLTAQRGSFQAKKRLETYRWSKEEAPRGVLLLVHGFGEHLGRYDHVADFFAERGWDVRGVDHVVHGHSEGFDGSYGRMDIDEMVANWSQYVWSEVIPLPGPHYIYCHSTGGLVTFMALAKLAEKWPQLRGVVFSAPLMRQPSAMAQPMYCCPTLTSCCLDLGVMCCGYSCLLDGPTVDQLSNYKAFQEATRNDHLFFGGKVNLAMVKALLKGTVYAQQNLKMPTYPFIVMVSPNDKLVDPQVAKALYEQAASQTKAFETEAFASAQHELHNEADWQKPLLVALRWLESLEAKP